MKRISLILALMCLLQGCFFAVGAAAGAAVAVVVYDHRTIEKVVGDQRIGTAVANRIRSHELYKSSHININCFNRVVLLTGETPTAAWHDQAGELARSTRGVTKVYNQLTIKGPSSSLTRASDTWISTKIQSQMLATKGLASGSIKVVVENGVVYLMGMVTHDQADTTVEIARQVSGVQKVMKIFQYRD